jgi:hypothetical protein
MYVPTKLRNTTLMMLVNSLVALAIASGLAACGASVGAEPSDPEQEGIGSVQNAMFATPGGSSTDDGACGPILKEPKEQKECERPATAELQSCTRACRSRYPHTPTPTTLGSQ